MTAVALERVEAQMVAWLHVLAESDDPDERWLAQKWLDVWWTMWEEWTELDRWEPGQ